MKNRNHTRALNDQQVKDITTQVADDLRRYPLESAENLIHFYLNGDAKGMFEMVTDWIETAEDAVKDQINHDLEEDSIKQYEDGAFGDNY